MRTGLSAFGLVALLVLAPGLGKEGNPLPPDFVPLRWLTFLIALGLLALNIHAILGRRGGRPQLLYYVSLCAAVLAAGMAVLGVIEHPYPFGLPQSLYDWWSH